MTAPSSALPVRGPLRAASAPLSLAGEGLRLLYADLDLAERADLRRALGWPSAPSADGGGLRPPAEAEALVLAAYRRWGADAPAHLGGAFAFALYDPARQAVVAARDPVGLRPLLWARAPDALVVGGDVRAVLEAGGLDDALDPDLATAALLDLWFSPAPLGRTFLRDVHAVPAGHVLVVDAEGARTTRYWRPDETPRLPVRSLAEAGEAMRAALREAAAEAVADAGPGEVGAHLSPGLDSSTALSFAAEALAEAGRPPPHAFTWSQHPEPGAPLAHEFVRMRSVADHWGLPLTHCPPDADAVLAETLMDLTRDPRRVWAPEAPVREAARAAGVRVLLSGWGGDEAASFSGRGLVSAHLLRQGRWGPVAAMALRGPRDAVRRAWQRRQRLDVSRTPPLEALREAALRGEHATFARPDVLRAASLPAVPTAPRAPRDFAAWLLTRGHLGERAEAWARAGAAVGVRYRYPLLDRRVLAVALGVPERLWLTRERRQRWVLREAGAGVVPDAARLGIKIEPLFLAAWRAQAAALPARVLPYLTDAAVGERAAFIDVARLRAALAAADGARAADDRAVQRQTRGFHALGLLALGAGHGIAPGALGPPQRA